MRLDHLLSKENVVDAKRRSTESSERKTEKKKQGVTREENSRQVLFDIQRANSEEKSVFTRRGSTRTHSEHGS